MKCASSNTSYKGNRRSWKKNGGELWNELGFSSEKNSFYYFCCYIIGQNMDVVCIYREYIINDQ